MLCKLSDGRENMVLEMMNFLLLGNNGKHLDPCRTVAFLNRMRQVLKLVVCCHVGWLMAAAQHSGPDVQKAH